MFCDQSIVYGLHTSVLLLKEKNLYYIAKRLLVSHWNWKSPAL